MSIINIILLLALTICGCLAFTMWEHSQKWRELYFEKKKEANRLFDEISNLKKGA